MKKMRTKQGAGFRIEVKPDEMDDANYVSNVEEQLPSPEVPQNNDIQSLMDSIEKMQEAITQIGSRMDAIENIPNATNNQEVPTMENVEPDENKSKEEVHVGGENEKQDASVNDQKDKIVGGVKNPDNPMQEVYKLMNALTHKLEALTGVPEVPKGKKEEPLGETSGLPATEQPPVGTSPSGGGFDSDDVKGIDEEKDAISKVGKPSSDYSRDSTVKNQLDDDKKDVNEELDDDLEKEELDDDLEKEELDDDLEKEELDDDLEKEELDDDEKKKLRSEERLYQKFRNELGSRQSMVVSGRNTKKDSTSKTESCIEAKNKVQKMVKEYLNRSSYFG